MEVQLEILQGRLKQGKTEAGVNRFKIRMRRFVIGSDASCHMVCKSRTISDRHCMILIENGRVLVRDLNSHAGTFVNDVPVEDTQVIVGGDKLRIGRLEFRLRVDNAAANLPSPPTPMPATPSKPDEQAIETVVGSETVDALVTDILQEEDEAAQKARYADPSARYFRADHVPASQPADGPVAAEESQQKQRPKKKSMGKLPTPTPIQADNTVSAAELALQEIFHSKGPGKSQ